MKYPPITRLRPPDPAGKTNNSLDDMASGRHDLQYFEMFCNVGAGKANRFNGNVNWVLKPALSATVQPVPGKAVRGKVGSVMKTEAIPELPMPS
jgi:hypothetical protein